MNGAPKLPESHQRALNWSAVRDEVQDFERNIRAVSGGGGLIRRRSPRAPPAWSRFPISCRRRQSHRQRPAVRSRRDRDLPGRRRARADLPGASQRRRARRAARSSRPRAARTATAGPNWTNSALDFTPPPAADQIVDAQLVRFLCRVGTFDPTLFTDGVSNEIRANNAANVQARGILGFNVPSLISVFASAPYLHSGARRRWTRCSRT